ncbi:MAG TPA: L-threonylcarbamoyladenylate synthase [Elusimicrobiota bacterium]|nr:L-threonylcarbamoyladenylate synthase [Elusimicrobiota bacterium]
MKVAGRGALRTEERTAVQTAVESLRSGGLVVFPTDTVYGLAAGAFRPEAIGRIYRLKGRSYKKPLPFLVAHLDQARALVEPIPARLRRLLDRYWPGPLTVIFKTSPLGRWVAGGKDTIAVRIPKHRVALELLREFGQPLATTSVNISGGTPARSGTQARTFCSGKVGVVLDAGRCPVGEPSTILDASTYHWVLRREGAIKEKELLKYLRGR